MRSTKTLALIAHDGKKDDMIQFVQKHALFFKHYNLMATGTTAKRLKNVGVKVKSMLSGPLGGDAQIAALVATGKCMGVIFFRDPLGMHPHEPDISMLLRICEVHNVPLATNPATAELMIKGISLSKK